MGEYVREVADVPQMTRDKITSLVSCSLPLGKPLPPNDAHAVSVSMPTWRGVAALSKGEDWAISPLQTSYPRFDLHDLIRDLVKLVKARLALPNPDSVAALVFATEDAVQRCVSMFKTKSPAYPVQAARFFLSDRFKNDASAEAIGKWANFYVVLHEASLEREAMQFWEHFGDGISSRQAEFINPIFDFLDSESVESDNQSSRTSSALGEATISNPPDWTESGLEQKLFIKSTLAKSMAPSGKNQKSIAMEDVFLYANGMSAIGAVSRGLARHSEQDAIAVVYGWPYAGTVPCVKASGFGGFTWYGHGTGTELDQLEDLMKKGTKVGVLFCEIPSNPQLQSPDLHRLRQLADQYDFPIICDDTLATSVNLDILPYADVIVSSLTKIFSGACNVMGGSVVTNPSSVHHDRMQEILRGQYTDLLFPRDAMVLAENCTDFVERVYRCNDTAARTAARLAAHPSVQRVNYPSMVASTPHYDRCRREGGGYGFLLSVVFHENEAAVRFYDSLDVCKGPSVGTDFTIALPYSLISHADELEFAAAHGVPEYIVRLSLGLEDPNELLSRVDYALEQATGKR